MGDFVFGLVVLVFFCIWAAGSYLLYRWCIKRTITWTVNEGERTLVRYATIGSAMAIMYVFVTLLIVLVGTGISAYMR